MPTGQYSYKNQSLDQIETNLVEQTLKNSFFPYTIVE